MYLEHFFKKEIEILEKAGFKPIAVCEPTQYVRKGFLFKTEEEADEAHEMCHKQVDGLFYAEGEVFIIEREWIYINK